MSRKTKHQGQSPDLSEEQVAAYLAAHPEFFTHHPSLLENLTLSHECGPAVSLIERQVAQLRQKNLNLRHQLNNLIQVARENDALLSKLHILILSLLQADSLTDVVAAVEDTLRTHFLAEWVTLKIFAGGPDLPLSGIFAAPYHVELFQTVLEEGSPYIGPPTPSQVEFLFPSEDEIRSCALIPLRQPALTGILAIGSRDLERFTPNLGKVILARLGEVIGMRLNGLIHLSQVSE
ncbi:MAG: hypothetical protein AXA67_00395 [Methylothermaceae bacteria B42]|nr:MAG: hypothetical protein AXA67_00395 [Methylothermaceae bacteria B42]HHJ38825.1 DUF484 family protein [Methylothermaceae bacterium]